MPAPANPSEPSRIEQAEAALLDAAPDAMLIVDINGVLRRVNRQAEVMFGYAKDELIGGPIDRLLPEHCRAVHGQHVATYAAAPRVRRMGTIATPLSGLRKNGEEFPVDVSLSPLTTAEEPLVIAAVRDVTAQKQTEQALHESEERLSFALETSGTGAWDLDLVDHSAHRTPVHDRIFGYETPLPQWTYGMFLDHVLPEDRGEVDRRFREATAAQTDWSFECRIRRADGMVRWILAAGRHQRNASGQARRMTGIVQDITERKRIESEVLQAQKMDSIGRLAGGIAHDFNNLLTPIVSYAGMLQSRFEKGDPAWEEIEEIRGAANHAADLTRQLLAFGRQQILRPRPLDINVAIVGIKNLLTRAIGEDVDMALRLGGDLWRTMLDPVQVEQVLMNLAANARDAMSTGGKLTIETANIDLDADYAKSHVSVRPGPYVLLAVSDTGSGIDDGARPHIFDPFFTTKQEQGTGLGLASVYGIVKQSGGHIWVYSEPGKGTTFKVYFPKTDDKDVAAEPSVSRGTTTGGTETILVVEDNAAIRRLVARLLERTGYTVLQAATPHEAFEASSKHRARIHLLVCDVILPDMNGRVLCDKLLEARPELRALFMSGFTQNAVVHRGVLDKGVEFLEKPFVPSALLERVREILDRPLV